MKNVYRSLAFIILCLAIGCSDNIFGNADNQDETMDRCVELKVLVTDKIKL